VVSIVLLWQNLLSFIGISQLDGRLPAYDGRKSLYTAGPLPFPSRTFEITLQDEEESHGSGQVAPRYTATIIFLLNVLIVLC
jgi:hypothetical protein